MHNTPPKKKKNSLTPNKQPQGKPLQGNKSPVPPAAAPRGKVLNQKGLRPNNTQTQPLLSKETARREYERLYNIHTTDIGELAAKVVVFQHNLEKGILKEITGLNRFNDTTDPNDNDKPFNERKVIKKRAKILAS